MPAVTEFDTTDIRKTGIRFKNNGVFGASQEFGIVGTLSGEPEVSTLQKMQGAKVLKSITKTTKLTMTVSGHIPLAVARDYFGLSNEGLKAGVYAAGTMTKGKEFILTVTAVDEFEDNEKLIAFPNCSNTAGFKVTPIEAGVEEVAMLELTFDALPDEDGKFYYEAIVAELTDNTVATTWHTAFSKTLVELVAPQS